MGHHEEPNTNGKRSSRSGQERDNNIHQQNSCKNQVQKCVLLGTAQYPDEGFIERVNHHTRMIMIGLSLLSSRDGLGFLGE